MRVLREGRCGGVVFAVFFLGCFLFHFEVIIVILCYFVVFGVMIWF